MTGAAHLSPPEHYTRAEELLAAGVEVVQRIGELADERRQFNTDDLDGREEYRHLTAHMDELGKKAMGVWAQAQVHATLAQCPNWDGEYFEFDPGPLIRTETRTATDDRL